jgi:hypothetical protein
MKKTASLGACSARPRYLLAVRFSPKWTSSNRRILKRPMLNRGGEVALVVCDDYLRAALHSRREYVTVFWMIAILSTKGSYPRHPGIAEVLS